MKNHVQHFVLCILVLLATACGKVTQNSDGEVIGFAGEPSFEEPSGGSFSSGGSPSHAGSAGKPPMGGSHSMGGAPVGGSAPSEAGMPSTAGAGGEANPFACPRSTSIDECGDGWALCAEQPISDVPRSSFIKGSGNAIYWYAYDGKRYVFPNEKTFRSWSTAKDGCPMIYQVPDAGLAATVIGGNMHIRPGSFILKITTDPGVYAVSCGGIMHRFESEALAATIYGPNWYSYVMDVPDAFFVNYAIGSRIYAQVDYDPYFTLDGTPTPDQDIICSQNNL